MSFLITTIVSILIFSLVVMIHELGHFLCAKKAGIQVNEFSIGMGPALFTRVKNGTRYSVRALPVGGYVSMEGEDEELEEEEPAPGGEEPLEKTGLPYPQVKVWKRFIVVAAGAVMNLVLGFVVLLVLFSGADTLGSRTVALVEEGSSVEASGLQVGDEILAINGRRCFVTNDIVYELQRSEDFTADFTVRRNGEKVQLDDIRFDQVETGDTVTMDMGFKVYALEKTPLNVIRQAFDYTLFYARLVFRSLLDLVTQRVSVTELTGPVGIVSAINQAAGMGVAEVLSLLALLTVNLGIFNLLPFPALDGGKLVFLLIEGIFRRPLPKRFEIWVNLAGLFFLFAVMIFATVNDITRLF
ncbi:MAG TPA: RIP metalloprotease RseP [Candidatus Fournierella merdigallinarum]|nr:RIP metalloprotease RseP [Candidatus Fournierella merdigallinarum]